MLAQHIRNTSLTLLLAAALPSDVQANTTASAAYAKLMTLAGAWNARSTKGASIRVSLRTISNDSALVETYVTASGKETLTIFHLDGERLLATHYCGQGNQPRLALDRASEPGHLVFRFIDATNLAVRTDSHLVQLDFVFTEAGKFDMTETYEQAGKRERTTLEFQRAS
ncbi:MAG: hypothetical protein ABW321_30580 [Polyangiales bacterium]